MQIKPITVNAAEMMVERQSILGNGLQVQTESNHMFAPECKVTISQEGRNLSRQQTAQAESNVQNAKSVAAESNLLGILEERSGLRESLTEMYRRNGFTGEELQERVNDTYQEIYRRAQGGIQLSRNESSEEAMAAVKELAQKALRLEDIAIDPSRARDLTQEMQQCQEYKA